jgi:predicted transcriptional regulator of viral defense system
MAETLFDRLLTVAGERHGVVTTADARAEGIDPAQLRVLANRGRLEHLARGVYRISAYPIDNLLPYAGAAAWAGERGAVSHESALAMRELGDFNPSKIDVTLPAATTFRGKLPATVALHRADLGEDQIEYFDGVRTVTVATALAQVLADGSDPFHVRRAVADAYAAGHLSKAEANRLRQGLFRASA